MVDLFTPYFQSIRQVFELSVCRRLIDSCSRTVFSVRLSLWSILPSSLIKGEVLHNKTDNLVNNQ